MSDFTKEDAERIVLALDMQWQQTPLRVETMRGWVVGFVEVAGEGPPSLTIDDFGAALCVLWVSEKFRPAPSEVIEHARVIAAERFAWSPDDHGGVGYWQAFPNLTFWRQW